MKPYRRRDYGLKALGFSGAIAGASLIVFNFPGIMNKLIEKTKPEYSVRRVDLPVKAGLEKEVEETIKSIESKDDKICEENPYMTNDFSKDSDEVLLARMIYGEARGCSKNEKIDVAFTSINRAKDNKKWNGTSVREAILTPKQYSCFNENDVNIEKLKNPDPIVFEKCLEIAKDVLDGKYDYMNKGQTHYFNPKKASPSWQNEMQRIYLDNVMHKFYKED